MDTPLIEVENLKKHYPVRSGLWGRVRASVKAVDGVSLKIMEGETLGVVGESGCGKTTLGRLLLRLVEATEGRVVYQGRDVLNVGARQMRELRRSMQIIFQDPYSSLNPRMTVGGIIGEALKIHELVPPERIDARVAELMELVGLQPSYGGVTHMSSPAVSANALVSRVPWPSSPSLLWLMSRYRHSTCLFRHKSLIYYRIYSAIWA